MQRRSKPLPWRGKGISDTLDASTAFTGAMTALANLIPDPSTANLWQCRPASELLQNFNTGGGPFSSGFSTGFQMGTSAGNLGQISVFKIVGNFVYGMIGSSAVPGFDQPFCFNLATLLPVAVTGSQSSSTLPASQPTSGTWIPPQMDVISSKVMVAHPGFAGISNNWVGWFDISTPSAPVWNAGQLTGAGNVRFTVAPTAVAQFNGRAYYIHNLASQPAVIFSDSLAPTVVTNANQVLTFNDNQLLTQLGKLPLNNQLGGVIQSIMVFKDASNIFQITGDPTTSNLFVNALNCACGTAAPNSVCSTPKGLAFMSNDGMRVITFDGNVSDPVGNDGKGIVVPFVYSVVPSRVAAACNASCFRISTQNGNVSGSPNQEYWYDFARQIWTGPHTFPAALIEPFEQTFVTVPIGTTAELWQSDYFQSSTSVFTENSAVMTWKWQTPLLPDTDQITNNAMTEATLDLALPATAGPVTVSALDQQGTQINAVTLQTAGMPTIWGNFTWGNAFWGGLLASLAPYQLEWTEPIVFSRMSIAATGSSAAGFKIGTLHMLYQMLKTYTSTAAAA